MDCKHSMLVILLVKLKYIFRSCNGVRGWFPSNYVTVIQEMEEFDMEEEDVKHRMSGTHKLRHKILI